MSDYTYWLTFFAAVLVLNLSPGPDVLYMLSQTVGHGIRVGLASVMGLWVGAFVHVLAAALGLSAILLASARVFMIVKYIGAAYLVYLGVRALLSRGVRLDRLADDRRRVSPWQAFRRGVLVDLLNPKVAVFFMAFLPQFVRLDHGNASLQLAYLGALVILVAIPVETTFVLSAGWLSRGLRNHPAAAAWLDRLVGSVLVGLGIRLALCKHRS